MKYLTRLYETLTQFMTTNTGYFIVLTCFIIEILVIHFLRKKKKPVRNLKIYNFKLNILFLLNYIIIFIFIIAVLRYIRWGYTFDLFLLYKKITILYNDLPLLLFYDFLFLFLILFLLLVKIKNFLHTEILKKHLHYYYSLEINALKKK
jgi:hypothetical protein